jgi:hypothetical protein
MAQRFDLREALARELYSMSQEWIFEPEFDLTSPSLQFIVQLILLTEISLESGEMTMVHGIDLQFVVDFKESTLV